MAANSKTILKKDIKVEGNLFEKEDIELDGEIKGNIRAENFETLKNSKVDTMVVLKKDVPKNVPKNVLKNVLKNVQAENLYMMMIHLQ